MEEMYINHFAVFVAAISMFVLGGLCYRPLFGRQQMQASGFNEEDLKNANPAKQYGISLLFSIIMAYNLAAFWVIRRRTWHRVLRRDSWPASVG